MNEDFRPSMTPALKGAFLDFISNIKIDSKETGGEAPLTPYGAQLRFLDELFSGLEEDIHWFVVLKARQLGISTISLALDLFWLSMFPGLKGALVTDTQGNKEAMRLTIRRMLDSLPARLKLPVFQNNAFNLVLANGSSLDYLVAGTKKNGGLGRSRGLNFLHATECSSWGDPAGLESLTKSLAQHFPARLYVFESTARGPNIFYDMWQDAKSDTLTKKGIFIGWWAKETYAFMRGSALFTRYGSYEPTKEEARKIALVKEQYGVEVTMPQLAWYRHEKDPSADAELDVEKVSTTDIFEQEMPWDEEEAFIMSGSGFFNPLRIAHNLRRAYDERFKAFRYEVGTEFLYTQIEQVRRANLAHLKVWEEPVSGGVYTVGADPAYGSSDESDSYVIQVMRCYADRIDQVAEFQTVQMETQQFAWILAHVCGAYNNVRMILEITGPGQAVYTELKALQQRLASGYLANAARDAGLENIFGNVKQYLYKRADAVYGGSSAYHWKTTAENKSIIYNQFRDAFTIGQLKINSVECLNEMKRIVQNGLQIKGEGSAKDDRPMAMALAIHAWIAHERTRLITDNRTYANERKRGLMNQSDLNSLFQESIIKDFFERQGRERRVAARAAARASTGRRAYR